MKYACFLLILIIFVIIDLRECKKNDVKRKWKRFKTEYHKTYNTSEEENKRYTIFRDNIQRIEKHNKRYKRGIETYVNEINRFGDLTDKEFGELYGLAESDGTIRYEEKNKRNKKPSKKKKVLENDHLDWREAHAVTPAKDQGKCGSCWIFSAVGALESYNFRRTGKLVSLSEQSIVDCLSNHTCDGGDPHFAFSYITEHGIYPESEYPYTANQDDCKNITNSSIKIDFTATETGSTDEDIKQSVKLHGPLSICLYASHKWRFYKRGVWYENECSPISNHCVLIVGYGTEKSNDYWLIKNSWGPDWGQDGYIKIARNKYENYCGISDGLYIVDDEKVAT